MSSYCAAPTVSAMVAPAGSEPLFDSNRGIAGRLMFNFGIEFRAKQDNDCGHPHPHHGPDGRSE
jgi:hypothetical protein